MQPSPRKSAASYQVPPQHALGPAAPAKEEKSQRGCPPFRAPLLALFGLIILVVVGALTALVLVLNGLLMAEADRSAKNALSGALDHAIVMAAEPFAATEPLARRMAEEMTASNDSCIDGTHVAAAMGRRWMSWKSTIRGAHLPLYYLYEAFQVDGDFSTWSSCGCAGREQFCDFQYNGSWNRVSAAGFPNISTEVVVSYSATGDWNGTGQSWVENVRALVPANANGSWSQPNLWYDPSTQRSTAFISFIVPTRFGSNGRAISAEVIDLLASGLSEQLNQVTLPDTKVIIVHPGQQTLLATTYDISLTDGTGASATLWKMTATPSAALNDGVAHFRQQLADVASGSSSMHEGETIDMEKDKIFGFHPLIRGTLRLAIITVTEKEYFFKTAVKARLITILMGLGCAIVSVLVALIIWAALYRSLALLKQAMIPAARLRCDPAEFRAQGLSWISDIAALQQAFAEMNEKLHEAGAYLPPSVKAAWTSDSEADATDSEDEPSYRSSANVSPRGAGASSSRLSLQSMTSPDRKKSHLTQGSSATHLGCGGSNAPTTGIARLFKKARIAVLQLNFVGFHALAENDFTKLEHCSRLLTDLVGHCAKKSKGVIDSFQGDRYTVTFNAVMPCSAANRKAVACAYAIHKATAPAVGPSGGHGRRSEFGGNSLSVRTDDGDELRDLGLSLSSGVAAGTATVGDVGSAVMRRFGIIGHVVARASVLERLCRSYIHNAAPVNLRAQTGSEGLEVPSVETIASADHSPRETSPRHDSHSPPLLALSCPTGTKTECAVAPSNSLQVPSAALCRSASSVGKELAARQAHPAVPCVVCGSTARDISVHFRLAAVDYVRLPGAASAAIISAVLGECGGADNDEWLYVVGDGADDAGAKAFAMAAECAAADTAKQRDIVGSVALARTQDDSIGSINKAASLDPALVALAPVVQKNLALLCESAAGKAAGRPLGAFYEECIARSKPSRGLACN